MKFAAIDVETTGLDPVADRVTEIGIVIIEDFRIIKNYTTLVQPGVFIPEKITQLTGIDAKLVADAPFFMTIAQEINELTQNCIIVGQRVQFDYSFVKNEMRRAGISFTRKTLCTAELSQALNPGMRSYSLAALCKRYSIVNENPHRALPDAKATAEIFLKISEEKGAEFIEAIFSARSGSSLIPIHLRETVYKNLPATPGVYYFIGKNNKPVYIGKAAKIKSRVLSHFRGEGNSLKILAIADSIKEIRFRETGNELLASLLEDHEIRHFWPVLNAAQKRNITRFGVVCYSDHRDTWRMGIAKAGKQHCFVACFHQYHLAADFIRKQVAKYELNGLLCGLPDGEEKEIADHNQNFLKMMDDRKSGKLAEVYHTDGRHAEERGFIWIEQGRYKGFGFVSDDKKFSDVELMENLIPRYSSITSETIIDNFRKISQPAITFAL